MQQDIVVTGDFDEAARRAQQHHGGGHARRPDSEQPDHERQHVADPADDAGVVSGLDDALNRRVYTWTSPFNRQIIVRFRRPRSGTDDMIYRVLADQSTNPQLVRRYKALASIVQLGERAVPQPNTTAKFNALRDQIGFVGPEDDDIYDEPVNAFIFAYEIAMFPQQLEAIADAEASNLAPDDVRRIIAASGLEQAKK